MLNYIGLEHDYGSVDCITLIKSFYERELSISFTLPVYTRSKRWMLDFSEDELNCWISAYAIKTSLTAAKNYDLIAFKSKNNRIIHFGMFLAPNSMLHVEEGSVSKIDRLSDYWINSIYAVYRHEQLVR